MKSPPASLVTAKNLLHSADPWVLLVEVTLPDLVTVLRYARNTDDVEYGGQTYTRANFGLSMVENSQRDQLSEIVLTLSNVSRLMATYLDDPDDVIGAAVTLTFVHTANLDEDHSALAVEFTIKTYTVTPETVEFVLGGMNLAMQRFPLHEYIAMQCRHVFKDALCQYAGAETACDGTLAACRDYGNEEHFGGFPGLVSNNLVVVAYRGG